MQMEEVIEVVHQDKSVTLESVEKTEKKQAVIAVEIVNLLAKKKCTIDDAREILNMAERTIRGTSKVQEFDWVPVDLH